MWIPLFPQNKRRIKSILLLLSKQSHHTQDSYTPWFDYSALYSRLQVHVERIWIWSLFHFSWPSYSLTVDVVCESWEEENFSACSSFMLLVSSPKFAGSRGFSKLSKKYQQFNTGLISASGCHGWAQLWRKPILALLSCMLVHKQ